MSIPEVRYHPKHGWPKLPVPSYSNVCLGNGSMFKVALSTLISHTGAGLFVGVEGHGCYLMPAVAIAPRYAAEKLGLHFQADAAAMADFVNAQQGHRDTTQWGQYHPRWMAEAKEEDHGDIPF